MFVYSVNKRQIKLIVIVIGLIIMCAILALLTRQSIETMKANEINLRATNSQERIAYLAQFGWSVLDEPAEVKEIIIPAEFDDVYTNYNKIQLEQGFDLTQYLNKRVKKWSYTVTNYPGYENKNCIRANLLILDGKVIGGDVCSVELDGFMHGFVAPTAINENQGTDNGT
ncbi:MAG: DUF4830 domain-containing protein [Clostridiaceae bacterium]|jgi:hypothetical protein|nr:DUF4830 domain-containing protein [Clostridiaceae bacterium]